MPPQGAPSGTAAALGTRDQAACRDDEGGGVFGGPAGHFGQYRGVGVGREHDAGMAEHVLHDLQVRARGEGEARSAVPEIMQADGRQACRGRELPEAAGQSVGAIGSPLRQVITYPLSW